MAEAAGVVGALGAALLLIASSRATLLIGLGLVLASMAGLAADGGQLAAATGLIASPAGLAAAGAAVLVLGAAAAVLVRWPLAIVPALLAVAPLRLPIAADPDSPVLLGVAGTGGLGRLYPLFAVLAAAVLATAWRTIRGAAVNRIPRPLAFPAAALLALTCVSILWTRDRSAAVEDLLFVWLPFAVLLAVAARAPLGPRTPRTLAAVLVGVAAAFATLALWQAATERLIFFNVALERANELGPIFRVTSAFQDPNHLGRHLVVAIAVVLVAAWLARVALPVALALLALLAAGLLFTYSQSSFVALVVVALAVAVAAGDRAGRRVAAVACAVVALSGVVGLAVALASGSAAQLTSERSTLVTDTAAVAASNPIVGVGVAAQPLVTRDQEAPGTDPLQNASHTTPLTVAAELGLLGLAALVGLVAGAARVLVVVWRRDRALALGLAAVLLVLAVHSLFYGGLFENPITWGALGVAAAATARPDRAPPLPT